MKLDKIKFAKLIAMIVKEYNYIPDNLVTYIDDVIDIDVTPVEVPGKADPATVDELMKLIAGGTQKIEAIKVYRMLTGCMLKESKDAVERYCNYEKKYTKADLTNALNSFPPMPISNSTVIENFIKYL